MNRLICYAILFLGIIMLALAISAGPHAFGGGMSAMVTLIIAAIACILSSVWELARKKKV